MYNIVNYVHVYNLNYLLIFYKEFQDSYSCFPFITDCVVTLVKIVHVLTHTCIVFKSNGLK